MRESLRLVFCPKTFLTLIINSKKYQEDTISKLKILFKTRFCIYSSSTPFINYRPLKMPTNKSRSPLNLFLLKSAKMFRWITEKHDNFPTKHRQIPPLQQRRTRKSIPTSKKILYIGKANIPCTCSHVFSLNSFIKEITLKSVSPQCLQSLNWTYNSTKFPST